MGVACATPVCDEANKLPSVKAENVVTNYTLNLSQTNTTTTLYQNASTGGVVATGTERERVTNFRGNNLALNVIATNYSTQVYYINAPQVYTVNYNWYNSQAGYNFEYATRSTTVFQIDSYNFNTDTNATVNIEYDIMDTEVPGADIFIQDIYYIKTVYICQQTEWRNLLNRQIKMWGAYDIIQTIEDPNENFYYIRTSQWVYTNSQVTTDTTSINLMPNGYTFVVIDYMPVVKAQFEDSHGIQDFSENLKTIPLEYDEGLDTYNINITGTNIIPDGTYEVIDIPGLMWEIITMPFAFVSQAFNLTLFPGTPYQLNISNLFLSIIAIFVFVGIISLFLKMKG